MAVRSQLTGGSVVFRPIQCCQCCVREEKDGLKEAGDVPRTAT